MPETQPVTVDILVQLQQVLRNRKHSSQTTLQDSYVEQLYQAGVDKIGKKICEEAGEVVMAAKDLQHQPNADNQHHLTAEATDLLFHLMVMLTHLNGSIEEVFSEVDRRMGVSGLTEKSQR